MMIDLVDFIVDSINKDRRLRIILGVMIFILSISFVASIYFYGLRPSDFIETIGPALVAVLFSFVGLSLAVSNQKVASKKSGRTIESKKDINEENLPKSKSTELSDIFYSFRVRMIYDSGRLKINSFKNLAIGIIFSFSAFRFSPSLFFGKM